MNRRGFLGALLGAALDPERLLWVPGKKLISIPAPRVYFVETPLIRLMEKLRKAEIRNRGFPLQPMFEWFEEESSRKKSYAEIFPGKIAVIGR